MATPISRDIEQSPDRPTDCPICGEHVYLNVLSALYNPKIYQEKLAEHNDHAIWQERHRKIAEENARIAEDH